MTVAQTRSEQVRPAAPSDVTALKTIIDETGLFPSDMLDDMAAGFFSGDAPDDAWLVRDDNGPSGLAYFAPERMTHGTWNLYLIAIRPSQQRRGAGKALMKAVEENLSQRGARVLLVETSGLPAFEATRSFYRGLGYDEEARIRDFYQRGEDKIVFRKALDAATSAREPATTRGRIHHLDLTVKDPWASAPFYDAVLGHFGYDRGPEDAQGFDWHSRQAGVQFTSVGLVKARQGTERTHDRYSPGLHHVAWRAASRDDVDDLHLKLLSIGATVLDAPADYPQYGAGYYAVFFVDPDGLKLEFVYAP